MTNSSLTHHLRHRGSSREDSILFYHHDDDTSTSSNDIHGGRFLTYGQCWRGVAEHQGWLENAIHDVVRSSRRSRRTAAINAAELEGGVGAPAPPVDVDDEDDDTRDVVVAYLADNSPDLLLSVLACTNLTLLTTSTDGDGATTTTAATARRRRRRRPREEGARKTTTKVLPAMINARWTPSEMERALRPTKNDDDDGDLVDVANARGGPSVTILLHGAGYEDAAGEAVRLMNGASHVAVALALPRLADYDAANDGGNPPSSRTEEEERIEGRAATTTIEPIPRHDKDDDVRGDNEQDAEGAARCSDSDALLLFTSGTSSPRGAKGVRLSHRSLLVQARAKTRRPCSYDAGTRAAATTVPWFHVGGMSSALAVMLAGGCLVFPPREDGDDGSAAPRRGFRPGSVLRSIQPPHGPRGYSADVASVNTLVVVPAMLHAIADHAKKNNHQHSTANFPNVRLILVGGQSIGNGKLRDETRRLFPNARIVQTYACTEAGSSITFEDLGLRKERGDEDGGGEDDDGRGEGSNGLEGATCVGRPPPHIQIRVFDAAPKGKNSGALPRPPTPLPPGAMGVIGTRGPHVMSGYWDRGGVVDASSSVNNSGWMLTNDLGYVHPQNGRLYFCGRANDAIRTGGESVLANEVERALDDHPGIEECAVFALPDERFGEAVCVAIVVSKKEEKEEGVAPPEEGVVEEDGGWMREVRRHCAGRQLAGFKRPRRAFLVRALPRNSSGKVLKHALVRTCASRWKGTSRL